MGTDIHIVVERKEPDSEWVGIYCTDDLPGGRPLIAQRDYDFFAEVAQVRGNGSDPRQYPRNLPKDVSRLAWLRYMRCPGDHHSASYMTLEEFTQARFRVEEARPEQYKTKGLREGYLIYDLLGVWPDDFEGCEHRVVFWFDN